MALQRKLLILIVVLVIGIAIVHSETDKERFDRWAGEDGKLSKEEYSKKRGIPFNQKWWDCIDEDNDDLWSYEEYMAMYQGKMAHCLTDNVP